MSIFWTLLFYGLCNLAEIFPHTHPTFPLQPLPIPPMTGFGSVSQTHLATLRLSVRKLPNTVLCSAIANQSCICLCLKHILGLSSINIYQTQWGQRKPSPLLLPLTDHYEGVKEMGYIPFSENAGLGAGRNDISNPDAWPWSHLGQAT